LHQINHRVEPGINRIIFSESSSDLKTPNSISFSDTMCLPLVVIVTVWVIDQTSIHVFVRRQACFTMVPVVGVCASINRQRHQHCLTFSALVRSKLFIDVAHALVVILVLA